ncbi:nuclease-related domain-containing protein [Lysinibacillus sp. G4S2]|uniref:nuclease-related domain-containing protein n=1 Tax=Lysinibacillus sp. G4S2 TaxID=3055859 RepID=UPI00259FFE83|nr:nuclease-related domain-containing protein [Lysinibacillus sp. G4S2]MDM5246294.1 nuclease-related domain-containing protein [Lysinibacillus sp. G4S2]
MLLKKKREVSSKQRVLEMIERRLPKSHVKYDYFQEMLGRTKAGIAGEQRVDREWREIYLEHAYYLLHDVELKDESAGGSTHQMDTLFMSQHFVLIVEIKNIVGHVEYMEDNHQFIRITSDGRVDGFRNPFDQVKRHARFLRRLFQMSGHHIPIEYIVVSANPNMIMTPTFLSQPIIHVSGLAERIGQLFKQHQQVCLSETDLRELSADILTRHKPTQWTLDIKVDELKKGALCSHCHFDHVLRYTHGKWRCSNCQSINNQSMLVALHDFRLMISNNITNAQFRNFFDIDSEKAVYYLLKKLKFEAIGENKNRKYIIPAKLLD